MEYTVAPDSAGTPFALYGVNVELMRWIDTGLARGGIAQRVLCVASPYKDETVLRDTMLAVLGGGLGHDFQAAEDFMYAHWHAHPEIGPYPCPKLLGEYQTDGIFYRGYRDHVVHQLRVYLLGLYIYDRCSGVEEAIRQEITDVPSENIETEFLLRWLAAALCHDVGYILENAFVDPADGGGGAGERPLDHFLQHFSNHALKYPLAGGLGRLDDAGFRANHDRLVSNVGWSPHNVQSSGELADLPRPLSGDAGVGKAWHILDAAGKGMGLPLDDSMEDCLKEYFSFTETKFTDYGQKFPDHGVVSALLLLRLWNAYDDLLACVAAKCDACGLKRYPFDRIVDEDWASSLDHGTLDAAARAVAIHNIDPRRYSKRVTDWTEKFLKNIAIRLSSRDGKPSQPLAFLLRLCDVLQDWDRQRFPPLMEGEHLTESKDVSLFCKDDGKIHVCYRGDAATEGGDRPTWDGVISDLKAALDDDDVDNLVEWDDVSAGKISEFIEINPDSWEPEPGPVAVGGAGEKTVPTEDELAEVARKIEVAFAKAWDHLPVRSCEADATDAASVVAETDNVCRVRLQLLHHAAESCRMASALFETVTVLSLVGKVWQAALFIHQEGKSTKTSVAVGTLLDSVGALEDAVNRLYSWFNKKSPRKKDEDELVGKRIEDFFFARVPYTARPSGDVAAQEFVVCLGWFRTELEGYQKKWRTMEDGGKGKDVRKELGQGVLRANLSFLTHYLTAAMEALENVVSSRTKDVEKCIRESSESRPEDVGEYMAELLGGLPHNNDKKYGVPIWRGKEPKRVGGGA